MSRVSASARIPATTARIVLIILLVVILVGMAGGFYATYSYLGTIATKTAKAQTDARNSDTALQQLVQLKSDLTRNKEVVDKAAQIVAESKNYQYQNQIIDDLNGYARRAGLTITSFTFQDSAGAKPGATGATPAPAATGTTPPVATPSTPGTSLKTTNVSIQLGGNLTYENLLHFLHLVEQNLTRMQVASVMLTRGEAGGSVGSQTLNLEVYIR